MPILIKDYSWRQVDDMVIVRVPLRNIPHKKVDLFHSDNYIKVHFPPFLFECCLYEPINEDGSRCTLVQGEAVFELAKSDKKEWVSLEKDITKEEMMQIKKEAIEHAQKRAAHLKDERQDKNRMRRDKCIGQQIALDGKCMDNIDKKKTMEKRMAFDEIMKWKEDETDPSFLPSPLEKAVAKIKSLEDDKAKDKVPTIEEQRSKTNDDCKINEIKEIKNQEVSANACTLKDKDIWKIDEVDKSSISKKEPTLHILKKPVEPLIKKKDPDVIPPLRQSVSLKVDFTYRAFPTPSRESKYEEEQEWLTKQKEARRKTGFMAEDLRPEENDPVWLLEKGKSFHGVGNYLGAISAFTHAILTWSKIPELYVARSNSQLCIGNFRRVLEDTSEALILLKPHVDSNAELRFQAHYNRGKALLELGKPLSSISDFVEALEIHPYREDINNLIDRAESLNEEINQKNAQPPEKPEPEGKPPEPEYIEPEVLAN